MAKGKKSRVFTDLNFSKQDLAANSHAVVAEVGKQLLLRVKHRTAVNSVYALKVLAKGQKVKSIKKVVGFKTKSMIKTVKRKAKNVRRRAKTAMSYPRSKGGSRYTNGRSFKSRRRKKLAWQVKGSPAAKRHMAKIRSMR